MPGANLYVFSFRFSDLFVQSSFSINDVSIIRRISLHFHLIDLHSAHSASYHKFFNVYLKTVRKMSVNLKISLISTLFPSSNLLRSLDVMIHLLFVHIFCVLIVTANITRGNNEHFIFIQNSKVQKSKTAC